MSRRFVIIRDSRYSRQIFGADLEVGSRVANGLFIVKQYLLAAGARIEIHSRHQVIFFANSLLGLS
jgi:hypothetical protein